MLHITGTAARKLTQMIKAVSTLGSSRHSSDKLNDLSTKFHRVPKHVVLENPLATTQTAIVPSIQNTRAHHVTLDTKKMKHGNLTLQNHVHFTGVVLKTNVRTRTKTRNLLAAGKVHEDEHGNTTHPTCVEITSRTKG